MSRAFTPKPTGATLTSREGVVFACWHIGIQAYEYRSPDARIRIKRNYNLTGWHALVDDLIIRPKGRATGNAKLYRIFNNAAAEAVKLAGQKKAGKPAPK